MTNEIGDLHICEYERCIIPARYKITELRVARQSTPLYTAHLCEYHARLAFNCLHKDKK